MTTRWSSTQRRHVERADIDAFLADVAAVCRRHGFSISHEDAHGAFVVERLTQSNIDWLLCAHEDVTPPPPDRRPRVNPNGD